MTTFVSRETARDALVTLFTTNASWQAVFGYLPGDDALRGKASVLTIRSGGTKQGMDSSSVNPTSYRFVTRTLVLCNDPTASPAWTEANAEDLLDELDREIRQVVRDNVGEVSGCDHLSFDPAASDTGYSLIAGELWRWEERVLWAKYGVGA